MEGGGRETCKKSCQDRERRGKFGLHRAHHAATIDVGEKAVARVLVPASTFYFSLSRM